MDNTANQSFKALQPKSRGNYMNRLTITNLWKKKIYSDHFIDFDKFNDLRENKLIVVNSGVLLFNGETNSVILGRYRNTNELCHMAGGSKTVNKYGKKRDKDIFETAIRECKEETQNLIQVSEDDIHNSPCIIVFEDLKVKFCYIVFVINIKTDFETLRQEFNEKIEERLKYFETLKGKRSTDKGSDKNDRNEQIEVTDLIEIKFDDFIKMIFENESMENKFKKISIRSYCPPNTELAKPQFKLYSTLKRIFNLKSTEEEIKLFFRNICDK